ncbi:inositol monophosphatase family protein [Leucobacter soli]|uniref:Inositol-1-monophosphatase n=1 Tax=Leucobacter soli TaxID=2812850 RepID=A0A916JY84_9MICO|nr:inositol monophosphatase family protein [Leucobacter soli]CAG7614009.1 3'(2'),5'-bisphosphate nucleotidase CysQ [Leucobacter soli]
MPGDETHEITALAIAAAREAGALALEGFRARDLRVDLKGDIHDQVTAYDRAAEARIRERILDAFPDSAIVGEEDGAHAGSGPLTWYVDPIDGTANFARGIAMWAVSIGVARGGEMIAGVIFDPANDQLFWADDRGAFLRDGLRGDDEPLRSWGRTDPSQATVALNFPLARDLVHRPELALEQFSAVTRSFAQVRGLGSTCIALAWIAAGWLDVTVSFETNPWDVAAGAFIIRRAGGIYRGYRDGAILPEAHDYLAPHYYAAIPDGDFELLHEIMRTQSRRPLPVRPAG